MVIFDGRGGLSTVWKKIRICWKVCDVLCIFKILNSDKLTTCFAVQR